MNIYLGKHFEGLIRTQVETGRYANASEVVREALRRYEIDEEKLARLRAKITEAEASFERGEGIPATDEFWDEIVQEGSRRAKTGISVEAIDAA